LKAWKVIDLATTPGYSAHVEAPARRKPNGHFEVTSEKFSGLFLKAQEDETPKLEGPFLDVSTT
jgi:hypothetical protein